MTLLDITDILSDLDEIWEDPALIMAALTLLVAGLGLGALFFLYPFGRDN
jgi:hypothetical protein